MTPGRQAAIAIVAVCTLIAPVVAAQQPTPETRFAVEKVVVNGVKRLSADQVVKLSGLVAGASVHLPELETAARRVADTGLFNNVAYRYSTSGTRVTVTLDIQEAAWTMPIVFDNFVWLTDADLQSAIAQAMPTFDGTLPVTDNARNYLILTLQKALESRNLQGTVEVVPHLNMRTKVQQYLAKVTNPGPRICTVRLTGASAAMEGELKSATDSLAGTDYSRTYVSGMSLGTLLDVYRKQGYWAARVSEPAAAIDPGCAGVAVSLTFEEGQVYQWDGTDWSGNTKISADELGTQFSLRPGDTAELAKIDAGVRKVRDAYGVHGHLNAAVAYSPQLSPDTRKVRFQFDLTEGPQFRMGTLTIVGLPERDVANLRKKWKLNPGDVYNTALQRQFEREDLAPLIRQLGLRSPVIQLKAASTPQTVDVTITAR